MSGHDTTITDDMAITAVLDPGADPILLAAIAYVYPALGSRIAVHPRCYPGLKRWLARFGDEQARQAVGAQGFATDTPPAGSRRAPASPISGQDDARLPDTSRILRTAPSDHPAASSDHPVKRYVHAAKPCDYSVTPSDPSVTPSDLSAASFNHSAELYLDSEEPYIDSAWASDGEGGPASTTNPYGFTARQALDPATDQMTLAQIAQYAPELRACLARNPNAYPALLDWLAQLHDPTINEALRTRQTGSVPGRENHP